MCDEDTTLENLTIEDVIDYFGEDQILNEFKPDTLLQHVDPSDCIWHYGFESMLDEIDGKDAVAYYGDLEHHIDDSDLAAEVLDRSEKSFSKYEFGKVTIIGDILDDIEDEHLVEILEPARYFSSFFENGNISDCTYLLENIYPKIKCDLDPSSPFYNDYSKVLRVIASIRFFQNCLIEYVDLDGGRYKLINYNIDFCNEPEINHDYIYDFLKSYIQSLNTLKQFTNEAKDIVDDIFTELRLGISKSFNEQSKNSKIRKSLSETFKKKEVLDKLLSDIEKDLLSDLE